jgi:hypothetical protein
MCIHFNPFHHHAHILREELSRDNQKKYNSCLNNGAIQQQQQSDGSGSSAGNN